MIWWINFTIDQVHPYELLFACQVHQSTDHPSQQESSQERHLFPTIEYGAHRAPRVTRGTLWVCDCIHFLLLHKKLPQTWQLKTTQTYYLPVFVWPLQGGASWLFAQDLIRLKSRCWLVLGSCLEASPKLPGEIHFLTAVEPRPLFTAGCLRLPSGLALWLLQKPSHISNLPAPPTSSLFWFSKVNLLFSNLKPDTSSYSQLLPQG